MGVEWTRRAFQFSARMMFLVSCISVTLCRAHHIPCHPTRPHSTPTRRPSLLTFPTCHTCDEQELPSSGSSGLPQRLWQRGRRPFDKACSHYEMRSLPSAYRLTPATHFTLATLSYVRTDMPDVPGIELETSVYALSGRFITILICYSTN